VAAAVSHPNALRIVALGPLTNIARALVIDAELPSRVECLVIMGGTCRGEGNVTAAAEYNWWFDPEAAASVLAAFPTVTVVPWETALDCPVRWEEVEEWHSGVNSRTAIFFRDILGMFLFDPSRDAAGWIGGDPLALCCCLYPEIVASTEDRAVAVECRGEHTRGACVVDKRPWSSSPKNATIVTAVDREKFVAIMRAALATDYEVISKTVVG
jgi:purine nucleosidase